MGIEMDNPQTVPEKLDAAGNLVEQMMLAHNTKDEGHFRKVHARAGELLFQAQRQLEEDRLHVGGPSFRELAEEGYKAYAACTGNKAFDGREMPAWEHLGEKVQTAWEAQARHIFNKLGGSEVGAESWADWQRPD